MKRATRNRGGHRGDFAGSRSIALLFGALAFVLQLVLAPAHVASAQSGDTAIAELSALTGEHLALCAGAADDQGDAPTHSTGDCGQCCRLGPESAASLPPPIVIIAVIPHVGRALPLPAQSASAPQTRYAAAQPRGPPSPV
jgi:hypothetical protein